MTKWPCPIIAALSAAGVAFAQPAETGPGAADEVELYSQAIVSLVGPPSSAGAFAIAERVRKAGGDLAPSDVPEAVVARLAEAGYRAEVAELAENGLWRVADGALFLVLREINFWPGHKIAVFSVDVGSPANLDEVAFKFRREEDVGWVLIEKGPAENEG